MIEQLGKDYTFVTEYRHHDTKQKEKLKKKIAEIKRMREVILTEDFTHLSGKYIAIYGEQKTETDKERRRMQIQETIQLERTRI
jgi:ABC-type anion transport system duplicated permease subunit